MRYWSLILMLLVACGGATTTAPSGQSAGTAAGTASEATRPGEASTDVAGLKAKLEVGGAVLIDVRTADEYASGHIPGARSIPLDQLDAHLTELNTYKDQDLYLVCEKGGRSLAATQQLASAGFTRPINVVGGTSAWRQAGYPVE